MVCLEVAFPQYLKARNLFFICIMYDTIISQPNTFSNDESIFHNTSLTVIGYSWQDFFNPVSNGFDRHFKIAASF